MNRARLGFVGLVGTAMCLTILVKLITVQVVEADSYRRKAASQYRKEITLDARRGAIYDRNHHTLALDLEYFSYGISPAKVKDTRAVAQIFSKVMGKPARNYRRILASKRPFVWLERKVKLTAAELIDQAAIPHLTKVRQYGRFYPAAETAAQVVGFSNVDNAGLSGLELQYDAILRGTNGRTVLTSDGHGQYFPNPTAAVQAPVNGNSLVLTLDLMYQAICEEELQATVRKYKAMNGMVILLEPQTGMILSMNCAPGFDPNHAGYYPANRRKNRVITDTFEPGSTFKLVTLAGALNEHRVTPEELFDCEKGALTVASHTIHDSHPYELLTVREIFEKSSNIGAVKIGRRLGANKLFAYARDFGLGTKTGIELGGEVAGTLRHPRDWSQLSLPSMSFGHEMAVTSLQMVSAYGAIANGGVLMRPYIVAEELDARDRTVRRYGPQKIRRVVSQAVADTLLSFMEGVVLRGTAKSAAIAGWRFGGKTGTARKASRGGYSRQYISSFVGVYPVDAPRFVCFMMIDSPRGAYYGSTVAAPAVSRILQRIGTLPGTGALVVWDSRSAGPPSHDQARRTPLLIGVSSKDVRAQLRNFPVPTRHIGDGPVVVGQRPLPGTRLAAADTLEIIHGSPEAAETVRVRVPRITGLPLRDALVRLAQVGLRAQISGSGKVVRQRPAAGTFLAPGAACRITAHSPAAG